MNSYTVGHEEVKLEGVPRLPTKPQHSLTAEQQERADALEIAYEVMPTDFTSADLIITAIYILTGESWDQDDDDETNKLVSVVEDDE